MVSNNLNATSVQTKTACISSILSSELIEDPIDVDDLGDLLKVKKRYNIYKSIYDSSSSDEDDLLTISARQQTERDACNNVQAGTSYGQDKGNSHPNLISSGTFLLIKVPTQNKKLIYRYVATCQTGVDNDDGEILVTFLRSVRNSSRKFKLRKNDVSYITFDQIITIIPKPRMKVEHNQEYYYFDKDVDIFEKF